MDGVALRDVYYDILNDRFAVFAGSSISVFDGDMQAVCSFNIGSEKGLNVARMSATFDYIYVSFNKDGVYNPTVQIYTWSGEYVGRFVVSSGADVVGSFDLAKTNIQGFTMLNNSLYFVQIRWTGTYGAAFLKVDIPEIETTLKYTLSIGESVAASADNATESNVVATPAFGSNGRVETGGSYAMGGVSDGEYLYLSVNGLKNRTTVISKVDPKTNKIVGKTVTFVPTDIAGDSTLGDNSKIFIKGDMLYCILLDGSMVSINTKNFSGENCDVYEADLSFAEYGTAISATWNDSVGKFAVLTNNKKLHIINEDTGAYVRDIALSNGSDAPSSVTADEKFIYVSYKQSSSVPVDVYTWDGIKVGSFVISGFDMGKDVNFNVQAIFFHRGQMHATVCSWTSGYYAYFDWIVEIK